MLLNAKEHIDCEVCSIILPVYNSEKYLGATIKSVLNQTYRNLEIIIIDDCSSDSSLNIIRKYASLDKRIKVIGLTVNQGCAVARNIGLKEATGDYIAFIDSDDLWMPDKLEKQIAVLKNTDIGLIYTAYSMIDSQERIIKRRCVKINVNVEELLKENNIIFSSVVCKHKVIGDFQFKKEWYHEDYVFLLTLQKNNIKFLGINDVLVNYRVHKRGRSFNKINSARYRWKIYRLFLNLSLIDSLKYFVIYIFRGVKKYA